MSNANRHVVAIFGGACAGSTAADILAAHDVEVVVFEQNDRPYGKIEDGLPRWHRDQRRMEYKRIDGRLSRPGVHVVPRTRLGADLQFADVVQWGWSAVLLANGAWRDRALPVPAAFDLTDAGLVYQNPFVYWFNHYEEAGYDGPRFDVIDDAVVIGGGLASVDVVKIINLELYRTALRARGIEEDLVEMEHRGITATLEKHGITPESLGVRGCTLYYRRRIKDMPLAFAKTGATPEQLAKTEAVREKMVKILADKFRVRVQDESVPVAPILEGGRLVGLRMRRTRQDAGKSIEIEGSDFDLRSGLIVSSIGSVPDPIPGVPTKGELYDFASWESGALRGLTGVFGLGNVLTGKGNIRDSRENADEIALQVVRDYLGLGDEPRAGGGDPLRDVRAAASHASRAAVQSAIRRAKVPVERMQTIAEDLERAWQRTGYDGDYAAWMGRHKP
jgi:ferredoxin--NADP+ reductase